MRSTALRVIGACAFAAWCGWASAFHTGTWDARITWWISTLTVMGAWAAIRTGRVRGLRARRSGAPSAAGACATPGTAVHVGSDPWAAPAPLRRAWPWVVLAVVVVVWEALGIATGPHEPHLTISALSQAFRPIHAALLATWMGVGMLWVAVTGAEDQVDQREAEAGPPPAQGLGALVAAPAWAPLLHAGARGWGGVGSSLGLGVLLGSSRAVGVGFWLGVVGVAVLIDAAARWGSWSHLTFVGLLQLLWARPVVRAVAIIAWLGAGWHLFSH